MGDEVPGPRDETGVDAHPLPGVPTWLLGLLLLLAAALAIIFLVAAQVVHTL